MASETFTFIETDKDLTKHGYHDYVEIQSAKVADVDLQFCSRLRTEYPEYIVTTVPVSNVDLILFADLGYASYEIDVNHDSVSRWRGYIPPPPTGGEGALGELINYARYKYTFGAEYFILYYVRIGIYAYQYILKEPRKDGETPNTSSLLTDKLVKAAGDVIYKLEPGIFVFDGYWYKDKSLYDEVQKSTWDKVILDPKMKDALTEVTEKFFDSKEVYEELGVAWKRGIIFYGPPGNGKTISIKALMHTLYQRSPPIPTLYVRNAPGTYYISSVFSFARVMSPCILVLEDIETIVNPGTRSYFFNEVDGIANNDGIMMVASTNYIERLDPGLAKRPSRFDRKYLFPLPDEHERVLYAEFWREKLKKNPKIVFPKKLCKPMAVVTEEFSFAYIQEAFIATLLELARRGSDDVVDVMKGFTLDDDDLDDYVLWRVFKEQAKILREDMDSGQEYNNASRSQKIDLTASQPVMPGAFEENSRPHRPDQSGLRRDGDDGGRNGAFLSGHGKLPLMSRVAVEPHPRDVQTWMRRS